jgi:hypothetical protein
VKSAVEWRGQLVVAGVFDAVAGRPARNVAAFDGHAWSNLAGGVPVESVTAVQMLPRRRDLVVMTDRHAAGSRAEVRLSSWDGSAWSPIALPPLLAEASTGWQAVAADDTIWVVASIPDRSQAAFIGLHVQGMFALVDTSWTFLGRAGRSWPWELAHWNGALHGLVSDESGRVRTLMRWNGRDWMPADAPALPHDESAGGLRALADGRLLITGRSRSWCVDGAGGWAAWPGLRVGERWDAALAGDRLFRLAADHSGTAERWDGALPAPTPDQRPAPTPFIPWRRPGRIPQPGLSPLAACAPGDSLCGWYIWDNGGTEELARARPRGNGGLEIAGRDAGLAWQFHTDASQWYRLTVRARRRSGRPSVSMSIQEPGSPGGACAFSTSTGGGRSARNSNCWCRRSTAAATARSSSRSPTANCGSRIRAWKPGRTCWQKRCSACRSRSARASGRAMMAPAASRQICPRPRACSRSPRLTAWRWP